MAIKEYGIQTDNLHQSGGTFLEELKLIASGQKKLTKEDRASYENAAFTTGFVKSSEDKSINDTVKALLDMAEQLGKGQLSTDSPLLKDKTKFWVNLDAKQQVTVAKAQIKAVKETKDKAVETERQEIIKDSIESFMNPITTDAKIDKLDKPLYRATINYMMNGKKVDKKYKDELKAVLGDETFAKLEQKAIECLPQSKKALAKAAWEQKHEGVAASQTSTHKTKAKGQEM